VRRVDQAKYDEKRRHILEAAEGSFRRDGFRGASIGDICAPARMTSGSSTTISTARKRS
jgi:AcrR family transcriptional regulator